jgi:hypothetical protein
MSDRLDAKQACVIYCDSSESAALWFTSNMPWPCCCGGDSEIRYALPAVLISIMRATYLQSRPPDWLELGSFDGADARALLLPFTSNHVACSSAQQGHVMLICVRVRCCTVVICCANMHQRWSSVPLARTK